jgi:hypothetical protein
MEEENASSIRHTTFMWVVATLFDSAPERSTTTLIYSTELSTAL